MSRIAIKVEHLSKVYQLGEIGTGTISRDLERWWARLLGRDDPFLRIGETGNRKAKGNTELVWSLKELNFEIEQGDAVGIIGRNGAGKSTLLKVLSRVTSPTKGSAKVKGRIASLLEVGTGFHPELTGRENVFLNGAIMGMRHAEIKRKFDQIVDFAGVERYIDTPVKRYSSGMYVRLAFAVAAHLDSEILIVDEVLAVGDAEFQKKCLGKMGEVSTREGRTVLFVSHNMESIRSLCNQGMVLHNGELLFSGSAGDAIRAYAGNAADTLQPIQVENHRLSPEVCLVNFEISQASLYTHQDLDFKLSLESTVKNNIQSLALFIYDAYEQKAAFIDLRCTDLFSRTALATTVTLNGCLKKLPLLPGKYKIGLHVQSNLLYKDFFNLLQFEVLQKEMTDGLLPYPLQVRGSTEVEYSFTIKWV